MSNFKGTPGPWHLSNEGCLLIRDDAEQGIVAKYIGYTNDIEEVANGNLIAAAPELLEALQELIYVCNHGVNGCTAQVNALKRGGEAINKALGGSQ